MNGSAYLADAIKRFRESKSQCDRAMAQVPFETWTRQIDPGSNSIATIMLHLSGNMLSRWTDFLTSDGEKPTRDRDGEFENPASMTREALLERWESGWACLFGALESLTEADLDRTITIRSQPIPVVGAINRQIAHYALHTGQVILLAKHFAGASWQTQSVARGASKAFHEEMKREFGGKERG